MKKRFFLLILLPLIVGIFAFSYLKYCPSSLVLEMKTSNYGLGQVLWDTGSGYNEINSTLFQIKNKGVFQTYYISLPARKLKALRIDPLQAHGDFEIKSVQIKGPDNSAAWSGRNLVHELTISQNLEGGNDNSTGFFKGSVNTVNNPPSDDPALILRTKHGNEFKRPLLFRIVSSVLLSFCTFLIVYFIQRKKSSSPESRLLDAGSMMWLIPISLYFYYFYYIWLYALDAPIHDEWGYFLPPGLDIGLPSVLTLNWLFAFHAEHRIVFTKLLGWLFFKFDNMNFTHQQILNYIIFGGFLLLISYLKKVTVGSRQFLFFPAFMIFLLSPIAEFSHSFPFENQVHFVVLFAVLAAIYAFKNNLRLYDVVLFTLFTLCMMFSFSAGVAFAIVYLICFSVFLAGRSLNGIIEKKKAILAGTAALIIIGMGLSLWFKGYFSPGHHATPVTVARAANFFNFYMNLLSHGFGFDSINFLWAIPCALIGLVPLAGLLLHRRSRWSESTWLLLSVALAIFASLAAISLGRMPFGIEWSKKSHYTEISFLLIPISAISWWLFLEKLPKLRNFALILLWIFFFAGYFNHWSIAPYQYKYKLKMHVLNCAYQYYMGIGNGYCPESYPTPVPDRLDRAKLLNISFTQKMGQHMTDYRNIQKNSIKRTISKGGNSLLIPVDDPQSFGKMRLDPGAWQGERRTY